MIITKTPFRISFFGGGSDYPVWLKDHDGAVLSTTIDKYCFISARYLPAFFEHKHRIVYSKVENVQEFSEIKHPSARACLEFVKMDRGVEIHHDGDLPARTGIGSSSSFTAGLLKGLRALQGRMIDKHDLALEAIKVEQEILAENVGCQDQIAAAYGGLNLIKMKTPKKFEVQPMTIGEAKLISLQKHLMLFYTGRQRIASNIAKSQVRATPKRQVELSTIRDMAFEGVSILHRRASDLSDFGRLLDEGWKLKRVLTRKTTTPEIDSIYRSAKRAGALGGKLLGAGGGGFMLLFARPADQPKIHERLKKLLYVPFKFENQGSQIIVYRP